MASRTVRFVHRSIVGVLVQAVVALALTAVLLAGIEIACGYLVGQEDALQSAQGDYVATQLKMLDLAPDLNPAPLIADPRLLWRNKPGAHKTQPVNPQVLGHPANWTIAVNTRGYRGPELTYPPDADDVYRVLCIGDSITYGFNVDQDATYPRQLEAVLRGRTTHPVEVINAGVPGWSWVQGRRFLEIEGAGLHPNVVVIGHGTNDQFFPARVTDEETMERLALPMPRGVGAILPHLVHTNTYRAILRYVQPLRERLINSPGCKAQIRETGGCRRVSVGEIANAVHNVRRLTMELGSDLLVLNVDFMETPAVRGSRRAAEDDHIVFLDMVRRFADERRADEDARAARFRIASARSAGTPPSPAPVKAVLRVYVPGATGDISVRGGGYFFSSYQFEERLYDDSTHGDEAAGDHVFTSTIEVPAGVAALEYKYYRGNDPEFIPQPPLPSSSGSRLLWLAGDTVGAVEVFGTLFQMAERTHPDARGQAEIAQVVADAIDALPSFSRFRTAPATPR